MHHRKVMELTQTQDHITVLLMRYIPSSMLISEMTKRPKIPKTPEMTIVVRLSNLLKLFKIINKYFAK